MVSRSTTLVPALNGSDSPGASHAIVVKWPRLKGYRPPGPKLELFSFV